MDVSNKEKNRILKLYEGKKTKGGFILSEQEVTPEGAIKWGNKTYVMKADTLIGLYPINVTDIKSGNEEIVITYDHPQSGESDTATIDKNDKMIAKIKNADGRVVKQEVPVIQYVMQSLKNGAPKIEIPAKDMYMVNNIILTTKI